MNNATMKNNTWLFQNDGAHGTEALMHVRNGMRVVEVAGEEVGTVEFVKMGNRTATTTRGSTTPGGAGIVGLALDAVFGNEADLPWSSAVN